MTYTSILNILLFILSCAAIVASFFFALYIVGRVGNWMEHKIDRARARKKQVKQ